MLPDWSGVNCGPFLQVSFLSIESWLSSHCYC